MSNENETQKKSEKIEHNYPLNWYYEQFCKNCWRNKQGYCNEKITHDCMLACIALSLHDLVGEIITLNGNLRRVSDTLEKYVREH